MLFEELDIKSSYDSRKTDVYNEFFNSVLPQSNYYRRFAGFFSAKRFSLIAEGLQEFIKENNGKMELVIIPIISEEDKDAIVNGAITADIITKNWINDLSKIKEKILEDHTKALSWMIANKFLEIKLALPEHDDGTPFSESELKGHAIFQREIGIFYNIDDDKPISFHGIIDREDSEVGELYAIDVSRYWFDSEVEKIDADHDEFLNFWNNDVYTIGLIKCRILPISKELEEYFKKIAPKTKSEIPRLKKLPILHNYQDSAVNAWIKNDTKGIFEMATGTGKTFTAIGCIKKAQSENNKILIIIAGPYRNLLDQWKRELYKWDVESSILESGTWNQTLRDEISYLNKFNNNIMSVFITSHSLFSDDGFVEQIEKCKIPTMLIVDEAHHVGTSIVQNGLSKHYKYRLALSATIERYFDQDGTDVLRKYFEGPTGKSTVASYSLGAAIIDNRLCRYNYYPFFVELDDEEFLEYRKLTYQAVRLLHSRDAEKRKKGEKIIMMRAKIVRDAANKIDMFKEILSRISSEIKHMLIFCSEKQFDDVEEILDKPDAYEIAKDSVLYKRITHDNPKNPKDRIKILNDFANEDWNVIVSNRVLDEGMDVPQAKRCIILASTGNPTQFIQRRGRVLRLYGETYRDGSKKDHADIYDILVKPQLNGFEDPNSIKLEIGMIRSQLSRIKQMSELALNKTDCTDKIKKFTYDMPPELFQQIDESWRGSL